MDRQSPIQSSRWDLASTASISAGSGKWLWGLLIAWVLFAGLGSSRLWDRDEPRNAQCTVEMLAANDWVTPTFNGELRTHKPILLYWMQGLSYQLFGAHSWSARLPSAFMALGSILAVMWIAVRLIPTANPLWIGGALATSLMFVVAGRAATPDAALICFSAWGVAGLVASQRYLYRAQSTNVDRRYLLLGYTAMGLAMLAKGPVGLVLPSIVAGVWLWLELHLLRSQAEIVNLASGTGTAAVFPMRLLAFVKPVLRWLIDWRSLGRAFVAFEPWWGVLLAFAIAAPWYVWVGWRTDGEWLRGFFWEHNLGRAVQSMEGHRGGLWYYPLASLLGLFPWSLLLIPIIIWTSKTLRAEPLHQDQVITTRGCRLGLVWMAVYMGLFSLAKTKLPSYITPCYCGAALLIGGFLCDWSRAQLTLPKWLMRTASGVSLTVSLALMLAFGFLARQFGDVWIMTVGIWATGLLCVGVLCWRAVTTKQQANLAFYWMGAAGLLLGGLYAHGAACVDPHRQDLTNILAIEKTHDGSWKAVGTIEPSWVFYLGKSISEIDEGGDWRSIAIEHLHSAGGLLILKPDRVRELESLASEAGLELETLASNPRFLRPDGMCIIQAARSHPFLDARKRESTGLPR